jgi:hypothetical protein
MHCMVGIHLSWVWWYRMVRAVIEYSESRARDQWEWENWPLRRRICASKLRFFFNCNYTYFLVCTCVRTGQRCKIPKVTRQYPTSKWCDEYPKDTFFGSVHHMRYIWTVSTRIRGSLGNWGTGTNLGVE